MNDAILRERLIAEINRVADKLGGRAPARWEYRIHGRISERKILNEFGGWSHAVAESGLNPKRRPRQTKETRAYEKHIRDYDYYRHAELSFKQEIQPWMGKYEKKHNGLVHIVWAADFHSIWVDPFCLRIFLDYIKRVQPDIVALVGDVVDFYLISAYKKDPSRADTLQDELDFTVDKILSQVRKACPNAQIDYFMGNHEWRLFKYLCSDARGLASLRCLQISSLLDFEKYKINLIARQTFTTLKSDKQFRNWKRYFDLFYLTHGARATKYCAAGELAGYKLSGASAHTHRNQSYAEGDPMGVKRWTTMGCMCRLDSGEEYVDGIITWQNGFGETFIDTKKRTVLSHHFDINNGFAAVAGVYYSKQE